MKKFIGIFIVAVLISINIMFFNIALSTTNDNTIIVDDEGDGDYISIQDAIDSAEIGDTIEVYSGIYEEHIIIDKQLTLIGISYEFENGDDIDKPIINANNESISAVKIKVNNCIFSGFQLIYSNLSLIEILTNGNLISDNNINGSTNILYHRSYGIILNNTNDNNVFNNEIYYSSPAVYLIKSENNNISNNKIVKSGNGIVLYLSNNNIISNCNISNNFNANGIALSNSHNNLITYNLIISNTQGVTIINSNNNSIKLNYVEENNWGIWFQGGTLNGGPSILGVSKYNNVEYNNIKDNNYGFYLSNAIYTDIRNNNFINNLDQARIFWFLTSIPPYSNNFNENYWSDWLYIIPKPIIKNIFIFLPYSVTFDWRPAQEPYGI